jgi:predicted PurR-regulated permease PerM
MTPMTEPTVPVRRWDFDRVFRLALAAVGVVALFWLLRYLADVLVPFAVALLLAYLLKPIVDRLETRLHGRRTPAVLLTVGGLLIIAAGLLAVLVPVTLHEFSALGEEVRQLDFVRNLRGDATTTPAAPDRPARIVEAYRAFRDQQSAWLQEALDSGTAALSEALSPERVSALAGDLARRITPGLLGLVSGALSFLLGLTVIIVVLIYLVFILLDYERVAVRWPELLPPTYKPTILQFVDEFTLAMKRYFRGQFVLSLALGVMYAIGFKLIGLRLGILLGLGTGLLNMVPYLQIVAVVPALLLGLLRALEHNSSILVSLCLVLAVFVIAQLLQETLLTPRIMGKATGLRPVVIMLGVFIWGKLLGFLGLLLAIPLTCLGIAYYSRFVLGKLDAKVIEET